MAPLGPQSGACSRAEQSGLLRLVSKTSHIRNGSCQGHAPHLRVPRQITGRKRN